MQFTHLLQCRCFEIAIQKGWEILFSFSFSPHPHTTHTLQRSQISLIFPYYNKFECSHSKQLQDMNLPLMLLGAPHLSLQDTVPNSAYQKSVTHCLPKRCSVVHLGRAVLYIAHTPFSSVDCPCSFADCCVHLYIYTYVCIYVHIYLYKYNKYIHTYVCSRHTCTHTHTLFF